MKTPLWKSRSFWTVIFDFVVSVALYFVSKYLGESGASDVRFLIAALQPVVLVLIAAFTVDDVEERKAQTEIAVTKMELEEARLWRESEKCH